ncbi:MAG TPA: hypothetical protein VL418_13595 [Devosiaceae bacterium]|nr:hypothetical protein [Devosiaceae bacterium]
MGTKITALLVFLLGFWSLAALAPQPAGNAQVVTRLALTVSILDRGSLDITPYAGWTVDKATFDGRVFADKTPGHPLLALPAVGLARLFHQLTGASTDSRNRSVFEAYEGWATIGTNVLISAVAIALVFLVALELGASRSGALFAAFCLGWATPFMGWSTAFFAHTVTGSFLLFAFAAILRLFPGEDGSTVRWRAWATLLLGLLLGYTLVVDLTAAPAVAILGVFALLRARKGGLELKALPTLALGGIAGLSPLFIYNALAFGSPLHLGYENTNFEGMEQGIFGVTWPNPLVLLQLLFGTYRGLLPLSPILLFVPAGLLVMAKTRGRLTGPAVVIALIVIVQFWINASYYYWNGGWSTGPRHLVAMLPLAVLPLAFLTPARTADRFVLRVLLIVSLALSLACALSGMFVPETILEPFTGWIFPNLVTPTNVMKALLVMPIWVVFAIIIGRANRAGQAGFSVASTAAE